MPISLVEVSSSILDSPNGAGSDFDGIGTRFEVQWVKSSVLSKFVHFETQIEEILVLTNTMSRMYSHIPKTFV